MKGARLVAGLCCALVLAACGGTTSPHGAADETGVTNLSSAELLDDPKSYEGPTHASLAPKELDPVADNPEQHLPVTVTDSQGTEVTVTDTSRVLALDIYGTLSQTVFELGLGDQVVGRDISTQFAEAQELPLVTANGHDLNAEAILALDPTLILTDTSLGPWDVILQMRDSVSPSSSWTRNAAWTTSAR